MIFFFCKKLSFKYRCLLLTHTNGKSLFNNLLTPDKKKNFQMIFRFWTNKQNNDYKKQKKLLMLFSLFFFACFAFPVRRCCFLNYLANIKIDSGKKGGYNKDFTFVIYVVLIATNLNAKKKRKKIIQQNKDSI